MLSEEDEVLSLEDCTGPYEKINYDGRKIKSISSLIKNEKNKAIGIFCINLDITKFDACKNMLDNFLNLQSILTQPIPLFKDDWQEKINQYTHTYLRKNHLNLETLSKIEKKKIVQHLNELGAFTGRNAAHYIAQLLKISRATVYNYLG